MNKSEHLGTRVTFGMTSASGLVNFHEFIYVISLRTEPLEVLKIWRVGRGKQWYKDIQWKRFCFYFDQICAYITYASKFDIYFLKILYEIDEDVQMYKTLAKLSGWSLYHTIHTISILN